MHALAFSTCWNAHRHEDGFEMLQEIRRLGFPAVELHANLQEHHWPGIKKALEKSLITVVAIQSNLLEDLSRSPTLTEDHAKKSLADAAELGHPLVILSGLKSGQKGISRLLERLHRKGKFLERAYTEAKLQAVQERRQLFPQLWTQLKTLLDPITAHAQDLGLRLGLELGSSFEAFPHEQEAAEILAAFPEKALGYWHNFGYAASKEILGWHTHQQTLKEFQSRLIGCHVQDHRVWSEERLPLNHGEIDFAQLIPQLPSMTIPVLELSPHTPEEQVLASRHLWNSYADI